MPRMLFLLSVVLTVVQSSCNRPKYSPEDMQEYTGPISEVDSLHLVYTDSGRVEAILKAQKQLRYVNHDEEFPKGFYLETFDETEKMESKIQGDSAYIEYKPDLWHAYGNVVLINMEKQDTLKTEELHWERKEKRVYTDAAVIITSPGQVLTGVGLEATDDFSAYEVLNVTAVRSLE